MTDKFIGIVIGDISVTNSDWREIRAEKSPGRVVGYLDRQFLNEQGIDDLVGCQVPGVYLITPDTGQRGC